MSAAFDSTVTTVNFPEDFIAQKLSVSGASLPCAQKKNFSSQFHHIWLRENCHCDTCYHGLTRQRLVDTFSIPLEIAPLQVALSRETSNLKIVWPDDHKSSFSFEWLLANAYQPSFINFGREHVAAEASKSLIGPMYWDKRIINENFPTMDYNKIISHGNSQSSGIKEWVNKTHVYGFSIVENVPIDPIKTKELIEQITFIKPTHYGGFWDFTSDLSMNDTAYTNIAIPLHTDGTYWSEAPGYQAFHLLKHKGKGGTTSLSDGVRCAYILRDNFPQYFKILSTVPVDFHSAGEENVFIQPAVPRPIIIVDETKTEEAAGISNKALPTVSKVKVIQIRWNNSDRSPFKLSLPQDETSALAKKLNSEDLILDFYKALYTFRGILHDPSHEVFYQLRPGQVLLFDNWRVLHSRTSFTGERRMCGAYYTKDDFISRFKTLNYDRQDLVGSL